jgi:drug/metabolite transporter (DMT)-like permease
MGQAQATDRTVGLAHRASWVPWVLLGLGICAASTSAILIRYARDADPLAISFWRCAVGAAVLAPFARPRLLGLDRGDLKLPAVAGAFLAVHFASWITSLELTTVASSVLLVSASPIFVALAAKIFFHERLPGAGWVGLVLALAGTAIVGGTGFGGSSLDGNGLALLGGATAGGYAMAGQLARRKLGILEYAVVTYSVAAVLLLVACLIGGVELGGYGAQTWWAIAGLIVGPQLLGHTVINLVLSDIDATTVTVAIMGEPIIAISLAFILFDEVPSWTVYPGGIAILAGIYLVSVARKTVAVPVE